jgi:probable HAF family extracellular repeat protein
LLLCLSAGTHGSAAPEYRIVDLSAEIGESIGKADDVNDFGQVVGSTSSGLVRWDPTGDGWMVVPLDMPDTSGLCPFVDRVYAMNNQGHAVGSMLCQLVLFAAVLWNEDGVGQVISLGGVARDINVLGEVVGGNDGAWFWKDGVVQQLGPGGDAAYGINNHSDVVGRRFASGAVMWRRTAEGAWEATDLGLGVDSSANTINDQGQVAGDVQVGPFASHPFLWQDGRVLDLGGLKGFDFAYATGINETCQVVGTAVTSDFGNWRGFLWHQGAMWDLNDLVAPGPTLQVRGALGINESGQIAGWGKTSNDELHAILLDPVAAGDVDADGDVDATDLDELLTNWGACPACGACPADLDGDCNVGIIDFLTLLGNWG